MGVVFGPQRWGVNTSSMGQALNSRLVIACWTGAVLQIVR